LERKVQGTKVPRNFRLPGTKVPEKERARGTKVPGNEKSQERKFPIGTIRSWERKVLGTKSPGTIVNCLLDVVYIVTRQSMVHNTRLQ